MAEKSGFRHQTMQRVEARCCSLHLLAGLLSALYFMSAASSAASQEASKGHALLISSSKYDQLTDLANPAGDIRALAAELNSHGFLVEVLESPTRSELIRKLREYVAQDFGPRDQLVIAFAGHGRYDAVTRIGYLASRDSADWARDESFVTLISYPWLLKLIDNINCPNIFLIVDACYSGSLEDEDRSRSTRSRANKRLRRFLTSGGVEYVPDGRPGHHTPFMDRLLTGLRASKVGQPLALEALQTRYMSHVETKPRWGRFGSDAGTSDFIFTRRQSTPVVNSFSTSMEVDEGRASGPVENGAGAKTKLRAAPADVVEQQLRRIYARRELGDRTWNPHANFPNAFRPQERGLWEVVLDLQTHLTWQQGGSAERLNRTQADAYINELNRSRHAGHDDWRLPTLEELASLVEPDNLSGLYISPSFSIEQETCWSADRDASSKQPYFVSFYTGRTNLEYRQKKHFVRAVRSQ